MGDRPQGLLKSYQHQLWDVKCPLELIPYPNHFLESRFLSKKEKHDSEDHGNSVRPQGPSITSHPPGPQKGQSQDETRAVPVE
jgi:hypothetical protein